MLPCNKINSTIFEYHSVHIQYHYTILISFIHSPQWFWWLCDTILSLRIKIPLLGYHDNNTLGIDT